MRKKLKEIFILIGLTSISLVILALFIIIGERLGLIVFYVGDSILGLSPLDTWLIIILSIFGPAIFGAYYLIYRLKIIDLK